MATEARAQPRLNRARVLAAAVALVDREGLAALSMRRLGQELGVEAMALYKHVPSKAALLDGMVATVLGEMEMPPAEPEHWHEGARAVARAYRRLAHAHPHLFPLVVTRPLTAPEALRPLEAALAILGGAGLGSAATVAAFRTIAHYVEGFALNEVSAAAPAGSPVSPELLALVRGSAAADYPSVAALVPAFADADADADFEFGLDCILAGLRRVAEQTTTPLATTARPRRRRRAGPPARSAAPAHCPPVGRPG